MIGPQFATEFWVLDVAGEKLWVTGQESKGDGEVCKEGFFSFYMQIRMKIFLRLSSFDFFERN